MEKTISPNEMMPEPGEFFFLDLFINDNTRQLYPAVLTEYTSSRFFISKCKILDATGESKTPPKDVKLAGWQEMFPNTKTFRLSHH